MHRGTPGGSGAEPGVKEGAERAGTVEAWLHNHLDAARRSLRRRVQAPGQTLILIAVLGFILALPAYAWLLLENARALAAAADYEPRIALYLDDTGESELAAAAESVALLPGVAHVTATSADDALVRYRAGLPDPALLDWLEENPLPAIIEVLPLERTPEAVQRLETLLKGTLPQAALVSDHEWVRRLQALHAAGLRVLLVFSGLLGLGVTLILAVAAASELRERREEIAISRITGATDGFLRRPSLYGGLWFGLGGGAAGYGLLWAGVALTRVPVEKAGAALDLPLNFGNPEFSVGLVLVGAGMGLGWIGARLGAAAALHGD
jgi:cell division transport system permease protein